jgi:hypothetical protein
MFEPPRDAGDDVLEVGPRRHWPRWVPAVAALAVAGAVMALLVGRDGGQHRAAPRPTDSARGQPVTRSIGGAANEALAVSGHYLYRFFSGALYRSDITDPLDPVPAGVTSVGGFDLTLQGVEFGLVLDPAHRQLFVISLNAAPATIVRIDLDTMAEAGRLVWPTAVAAAAVLDGHLFLAATNSVVDIPPGGTDSRPIPALLGQYSDLSADLARHRQVLFGREGKAMRVVTYRPADGRSTRAAAPFAKGWLAVAGDAIWAGGYANSGAVLARLDPSTLKPVAFSALTPQLGPGAIPVASGGRDVWVRSGSGGDGLWCVDGRTGDSLQYWQYEGAVASEVGAAYVATSSGPLPLRLGSCAG